MPITKHNPEKMYPQYQCYSHAIEIVGNSRLLIISGLNGYMSDGQSMPETFEEQCDLIWQHLGTILESANMTYQNLVSLRFYFSKEGLIPLSLLRTVFDKIRSHRVNW